MHFVDDSKTIDEEEELRINQEIENILIYSFANNTLTYFMCA